MNRLNRQNVISGLNTSFENFKAFFGTDTLDTVTVIVHYSSSTCGTRSSASFTLLLNNQDTVQMFGLCNQNEYDKGKTYLFNKASYNYISTQCSFFYPYSEINTNWKIYFGSLEAIQ